jgi:hypothetical protein
LAFGIRRSWNWSLPGSNGQPSLCKSDALAN